MGSDRNLLTSLTAELMPHSFGPRLEGRFAKQISGVNKRREDQETYLIILPLEICVCLHALGALLTNGPCSVTKAVFCVCLIQLVQSAV